MRVLFHPALFVALVVLLMAPEGRAQAPDAFVLSLTVSDAEGNATALQMGMDPAATDGFDPGVDAELPPPPPGDAFDTRIPGHGNGLRTDIRATAQQIEFLLIYRGETVGGTEAAVTLAWDDAALPDGALRLTDDPTGAAETFGVDLDAAGSSPAPDTPRDASGYRTLYLVVDLVPPPAPSGFGAAALSVTEVALAWTDNASGSAVFEIETSPDEAAWAALATTAAGDTTYDHTGLDPASTHCYRLRASDGSLASAWVASAPACVMTPEAPFAFTPESLAFALPEGGGTDAGSFTLQVAEGPDPAGPVALTAVDGATGAAPTWLTVPATVDVGVAATLTVDAGGLAAGTYTATVTADEVGYAADTLDVTLDVTPAAGEDYRIDVSVASAQSLPLGLAIGTAPDADDDFDPPYDQYAPPPPPDPAFDARLRPPVAGLELFEDFRASLTAEAPSIAWALDVRAPQADYPVTLDWSGATLPAEGSLLLLDPSVPDPIDLRAVSSYALGPACGGEDPCTTTVEFVHALTTDVALAVSDGWALLGLPNTPFNGDYTAVFDDPPLSQPPFAWDEDAGTYVFSTDLVTGEGFWAFFTEPATYTVTGVPVQQLALPFASEGWKLIAGPSCDLPVADIQDPGGIVIPDTYFGFDEVYVPADTLAQGDGMWVRVSGPGTLTLDCAAPESAPSAEPSPRSDPAAAVALTVRDDVHSTELTLGLDPAATDGFDPDFDRLAPPPPPLGSFDARIRGTDGGGPADYYADVRAYESGTEDAFRLAYEPAAGAGPVVLAWDPAALAGLGTFVLASDLGSDPAFSLDMLTASSLDTSAHPELDGGAYVVWSDATLVASEEGPALPGAFALLGSAPNPFRHQTRLTVDLPEVAEVAVEVFDVLGRRVLTLPPQTLAAGAARTLVVVAPTLPAGAYLYRLTARMPSETVTATGRFTRAE
ncbi:MAG: T9SS type A sorting domain-containing protein [Rubricoccaceae bacterium]|nr:T9SS type A sorting domain-containing protein [Rubricoccaceae bacterium]